MPDTETEIAPNPWTVVCEPVGENPAADGQNKGGIIIHLHNVVTHARHEVTRVAYARRNSTNKRAKFDKQLREEISKAQASIEMIGDLAAQKIQLESRIKEFDARQAEERAALQKRHDEERQKQAQKFAEERGTTDEALGDVAADEEAAIAGATEGAGELR